MTYSAGGLTAWLAIRQTSTLPQHWANSSCFAGYPLAAWGPESLFTVSESTRASSYCPHLIDNLWAHWSGFITGTWLIGLSSGDRGDTRLHHGVARTQSPAPCSVRSSAVTANIIGVILQLVISVYPPRSPWMIKKEYTDVTDRLINSMAVLVCLLPEVNYKRWPDCHYTRALWVYLAANQYQSGGLVVVPHVLLYMYFLVNTKHL